METLRLKTREYELLVGQSGAYTLVVIQQGQLPYTQQQQQQQQQHQAAPQGIMGRTGGGSGTAPARYQVDGDADGGRSMKEAK
jgi:hypothetical protein